MSVETTLYDAIVGDATLAALIGTRCYPVKLPDNVVFPALAYSVISQSPLGSGGCAMARVQVDCHAATYAAVKTLRDGLVALAMATSGWWYSGGPDAYLDVSGHYQQPIDFMIPYEV